MGAGIFAKTSLVIVQYLPIFYKSDIQSVFYMNEQQMCEVLQSFLALLDQSKLDGRQSKSSSYFCHL